MRRVYDDLVAMAAHIAAGWQLGDDLPRLDGISGSVVVIDLRGADEHIDGVRSARPLQLTDALSNWYKEWTHRNQAEAALVQEATVELQPQRTDDALTIGCTAQIRTGPFTYRSSDTAIWPKRALRWLD